MDQPSDSPIERAKIREVAAVFHSPEALEASVQDLLLAGYDRADIDRLAELGEVRKRLGPVYIAHEELADVPQAPRRPILTRDDIAATFVVVVSVVAAAAALATAFAVTASGAGTIRVIVAALLAALAAGALVALFVVHILRPAQFRAQEPLLAAYGIVLWVRTRSSDREEKARQILQRHGGEAIRLHEVEIEKRPEDIPMSSVRPDPWLGDERLRQP
jgi:hypothetical protein